MPIYPRTPTLSTNEVFREDDTTRFLTDDLIALETGKAPANHTHDGYAAASHTHTGYASADHTHTEYASENHEHTGYASSDERLKRNIDRLVFDEDREDFMNFINNLPVAFYNYKTDPEDDPKRIGLIAQDVLAANPTLAKFFVDEDENGMLGLKPADLVFPLIVAVQYLAKEVEKLKNEI